MVARSSEWKLNGFGGERTAGRKTHFLEMEDLMLNLFPIHQRTMPGKSKAKTLKENSNSGGEVQILVTSISNGMDLGPIVRHSFETGRPESLLHQLRSVVKKKEAEIEELCRTHYEEFILAVDELRGVLVDAEDLKENLSGGNFRLQEVGTASLMKCETLLESYSIKKNVADAIGMSRTCLQVLKLCRKCNDHVTQGRLYHALRILDSIEDKYLQSIPVKTLRRVIEVRIPLIRLHIEKRVRSEFNEWLVHARTTARDIGRRAIRQASSIGELHDQANQIGDAGYTLTLDEEGPEEGESIMKLSLTPLHRAQHIHACLGIQEKFRSYYHKNRLLQLNSDLEISSVQPFLDYYQSFLSQITGYFILEDRVLRTARGLLLPSEVEAMWEMAATKITSVLEAQFSVIDSAAHLLMVKDYVNLLGVTLRQCGFQVNPLLEFLDGGREKYHLLLLRDSQRRLLDAVDGDSYERMMVKKEAEYHADVAAFHLQTSEIMPAFPYIAPFSSMVPETCRIVGSFIDESMDYLAIRGREQQRAWFYNYVRTQLDKLLIDVLNEFLLQKIDDSGMRYSQAMQMAANIAFLEQACDFFLRLAAERCGITVRAAARPQACLAAKMALKTSREEAYHALINLVNKKVDEMMALRENIGWTSDETRQDGHEYVKQVIIYLDTIMSTAQQILPLDGLYEVGGGALEHVSTSIVAAFLSDGVKRFNANAVLGIDEDLKMLESFAENQLQSTGLSEIYREGSLSGCLLEARQLINLLLSSQPENFMNPVIRDRNYNALDPKKVGIICDKFKESPDGLFGSLSSRNTKSNARKRSMDMLRRRLRDSN